MTAAIVIGFHGAEGQGKVLLGFFLLGISLLGPVRGYTTRETVRRGLVKMWDGITGELKHEFGDHMFVQIFGVDFSQDEKVVAIAGSWLERPIKIKVGAMLYW